MYHLSRGSAPPWFAAIVVGLLALGSERVVRDQITAVGGRAEVKVAVVLVLLLLIALARRDRPAPAGSRTGWSGCCAGLALWSDWLVLPYLGAAAVVLLVAAGRELLGRPGVALAGGFVVGGLPVIIDNLRAGPGEDSLSVLWALTELPGGLSAPLATRCAAGWSRACRWPPGSARPTAAPAGSSGSACSIRCCWWPPPRSAAYALPPRPARPRTRGRAPSSSSRWSPARR